MSSMPPPSSPSAPSSAPSFEIRGLIINLTGIDVKIIRPSGRIILQLPPQGRVMIDCANQAVGFINSDIGLVKPQVYGLRGLPAPSGRSYYLVTKSVVWAAWQVGRSINDLLIVADPVHKHTESPELLGYQHLMLASSILPLPSTPDVMSAGRETSTPAPTQSSLPDQDVPLGADQTAFTEPESVSTGQQSTNGQLTFF